jgi:hypothetical protein
MNPFHPSICFHRNGKQMATGNINARKEEKENINVHDPSELRYWSNKYGVYKEIILEAVRAAGNTKDAVEQYIKSKNIRIV